MLVWNGIVASVPALVLQPTSPEEVAAAAAFARDHGLRLRVKRTGDEDSGIALVERCVTLDLSLLRATDQSRLRWRRHTPRKSRSQR